ncbi:MerR family transcriptional regulator [Schleiferilactobacillus shenzhenensis]|nr:MerR family transcriptional regulator [Schleiferilactobacillus shenzhenensis]
MNTHAFAAAMHTTRDTLRYYEETGLLVPQRAANHYWLYSAADQATFKIITNLKKAHLSLAEIKTVLALRTQPVTADCRADTLALMSTKQAEFAHTAAYYSQLAALAQTMVTAVTTPASAPALDTLIEKLATIDD